MIAPRGACTPDRLRLRRLRAGQAAIEGRCADHHVLGARKLFTPESQKGACVPAKLRLEVVALIPTSWRTETGLPPKAKSQTESPYIPTEIWLCFALFNYLRPAPLPLSDFRPGGFQCVPPVGSEVPRCDFHGRRSVRALGDSLTPKSSGRIKKEKEERSKV